jgi:hypothetical protein
MALRQLVSSRQRSQIILGTPHGTPRTDTLAQHAMFLVHQSSAVMATHVANPDLGEGVGHVLLASRLSRVASKATDGPCALAMESKRMVPES